jgi:very-short-patch-repair endonuclease
VLPFKPLRRAVREALARRRITPHEAATLIPAEPVPTRSDLEDLVLDLIRKAGLQMPRVNERLANGLVPDFRWPDQRLILEADGLTWHGDPVSRGDDAERQARLEAQGERVLRVSYAQVMNQPEQTIERLKRAGAPIRESPGSGRAPTASPARGSPPTPVA